MVASLPLLGLLAAAPVPFSAWFDARVKAEKPVVHSRFQRDLDGDGKDDDVACYFFQLPPEPGRPAGAVPATTMPVVLVGLASGERFALTGGENGPGAMDQCPEGGPRQEGDRLEVLSLGMSGLTGWSSSLTLRFDARGPLFVGSSSSDRYHSGGVSLLSQRARFESSDSEDEDGERVRSESAALVASDTGAPQPAPVWVSWGRKDWSGSADADLKLRTLRRGDGVTVIAEWVDDQDVRAEDAGPRAVLAADHLELAWLEDAGPNPRPVQLGVAVDRQGTPVATWFQPPGKAGVGLPEVRWLPPARLEVDLPMDWLTSKPATGGDAARLAGREVEQMASFTAVFSDSDGKGQETLVSTTSQRPDAGRFVLGGLYIAEPGAPFPRVRPDAAGWKRVKQGDSLRKLAPFP